jgi:predicted site-specific integrase-resolvase
MNNDKYISPAKLSKQFDITSGTLRKWAEDGKIRYLRPNTGSIRGGKRIYHIEDIKKIFGITKPITIKKTICYARVSSSHQKEDLERQVKMLQEKYPESKIIKDIGSGLNWRRSGFNSLLEQVHSGDVDQVVVAFKDRLCRFGFELVEWIFKKANVKLVVLGSNTDTKDISRELSDDLLAITTVFVAKNNGLRAASYKKQRKEANQKNVEKERIVT